MRFCNVYPAKAKVCKGFSTRISYPPSIFVWFNELNLYRKVNDRHIRKFVMKNATSVLFPIYSANFFFLTFTHQWYTLISSIYNPNPNPVHITCLPAPFLEERCGAYFDYFCVSNWHAKNPINNATSRPKTPAVFKQQEKK